MPRLPGLFASAALAALALLGGVPAGASGLQVAPVGVTLDAGSPAGAVTLSNVGEARLHAQVRVYAWRQDRDGDTLEPTEELVVSPPMVALDPGGRQLVRVIRKDARPLPGAGEQAFRIVVDELPVGERSGQGIDFVLRYSVPVFVENGGEGAPELSWSVIDRDGRIALEVTNSGARHAQIADVVLRGTDGSRVVLAEGLLGYALPGVTRTWATAAPWPVTGPAGTLEVRLNGQVALESLPMAAAPR